MFSTCNCVECVFVNVCSQQYRRKKNQNKTFLIGTHIHVESTFRMFTRVETSTVVAILQTNYEDKMSARISDIQSIEILYWIRLEKKFKN
jgi:hypothetical protein